MSLEAAKLLTHDHAALDKVLNQLRSDLEKGDVDGSHAKLDLFWARLAVHIRAEHLHLFPVVLNRLHDTTAGAPTLAEGRTVADRLRADHDFFMHELAQAIRTLRDLSKAADGQAIAAATSTVRIVLLEIEKRLDIHNELEENKIYRWATTILNEPEQRELANRISAELANRPARFSLNAWTA